MKYGDIYRHFKGTDYFFHGISLSINSLSVETVKKLIFRGKVKHHSNEYELDLYSLDGAFFISSERPCVIYQSDNDIRNNKVWAREVDDYFGYKEKEEGTLVKRFSLISTY